MKPTPLVIQRLRAVAAHILEEPKRLDMLEWGVTHPSYLKPSETPACNTVGCIAGWTIFLNKPEVVDQMKAAFEDAPEFIYNYCETLSPSQDAAKLLKLNAEQRQRLFFTSDWPLPFRLAYKRARTAKGRAKVTADRIEHFIKTEGAE
jgi:hypothetical protein